MGEKIVSPTLPVFFEPLCCRSCPKCLCCTAVTIPRPKSIRPSFQLTSEQLVRLCIERIGEVQPVLNCVVDSRFQEAIEEAQRVDRILASIDPATPLQGRDERGGGDGADYDIIALHLK